MKECGCCFKSLEKKYESQHSVTINNLESMKGMKKTEGYKGLFTKLSEDKLLKDPKVGEKLCNKCNNYFRSYERSEKKKLEEIKKEEEINNEKKAKRGRPRKENVEKVEKPILKLQRGRKQKKEIIISVPQKKGAKIKIINAEPKDRNERNNFNNRISMIEEVFINHISPLIKGNEISIYYSINKKNNLKKNLDYKCINLDCSDETPILDNTSNNNFIIINKKSISESFKYYIKNGQ